MSVSVCVCVLYPDTGEGAAEGFTWAPDWKVEVGRQPLTFKTSLPKSQKGC